MKKELIAISKTFFLFSLLVWLYIVAFQIAHPESVSWTFTRWLRIRNDVVGEISFVVSVISFLIWQLLS